MTLSPARLDRFARHIVLPEVGGAGQVALAGKHIAVIGLGGIGSPALQYLAAAGIGRFTLVDDDVVDASNLQRQTIFTNRDIGHGKATSARRWLANFDDALDVTLSDSRISVVPDATKTDRINAARRVIATCGHRQASDAPGARQTRTGRTPMRPHPSASLGMTLSQSKGQD